MKNMSDVEDDSLVSKLAIGWEITDSVLFRASASTSFRAPNIVQINEKIVVRSGTRYDWAMYRLEQLAGLDQDDLDSRSSQQRQATGAEGLPEESDNYSVGFVITPVNVDGLTITADYWSIDKENTIGLFGEKITQYKICFLELQMVTTIVTHSVVMESLIEMLQMKIKLLQQMLRAFAHLEMSIMWLITI